MKRFVADSESVGQRADVFVADKFRDFTRSSLSSLFENKAISVNGQVAKAGQKLKEGDRVNVDDKLLKAQPPAINLAVVYEDDDMIVINKPSGVLTHSKGALNLEGTVASFIKGKLTDSKLTGNRAGIVHRLDRATSGLIIAAKNSKTLAYLQKQFSTRRVKKTYLAVVEGEPRPSEAIINAPIGRNPKKPQTFRVSSDGKPAQTEYRVVEPFLKKGRRFSLVELKPLSGRTHQLRIHMAYIGYPVAGDPIYGHGGDQMLLHAEKLELALPNGKNQVFSVPPPKSFREFEKQ